jgi:hypothetical protein
VNAGNGDNKALVVYGIVPDPKTGLPSYGEFGDPTDSASLKADPVPYGSGILAESPTPTDQTDGISQPGNILVETPYGNILSTRGGISQFALNGNISGGPSLTLIAGIAGKTDPSDPDAGNVLLGQGGVVGGTVNVEATGKTKGYFVAKNNLNVTAESFSGVGLAGQTANISATGPGDGPVLIIGIGGINASGLGDNATLLSNNVMGPGGTSESTLGTSASASSASQSAAQQANSQAQQQVATDTGDDDQKKKKKKEPLIQRIGRVTVILSTAVPAR